MLLTRKMMEPFVERDQCGMALFRIGEQITVADPFRRGLASEGRGYFSKPRLQAGRLRIELHA